MSGFGWQDATVLLLALLALGYLVARRLRARRRADGACANCPSAAPVPGARPAPEMQVLISIGEAPKRER
ncbi:MAG TPA: hypothetical protein VMH61_08680 [Candidatus Acidoferrales bacterium]|nr:hypothetical protein [Candidatus Acidoferrales bacterium]